MSAAGPRRLLALETSGQIGSVAVLEGGKLLAERRVPEAHRNASGVLMALDALLQAQDMPLETIDALGLSVGPGAFTGLRVGLATALGLCFGTSRRVVPVSTLAALSRNAQRAPLVSPLLDARKGQIYAGLYGPAGEPLAPDCLSEPGAWARRLAEQSAPVVLLGSGAARHADVFRGSLGARAEFLDAQAAVPRAAAVGELAVRGLARGEAVAPESVELRYLRPPDAELRRSGAADVDRPAGRVVDS